LIGANVGFSLLVGCVQGREMRMYVRLSSLSVEHWYGLNEGGESEDDFIFLVVYLHCISIAVRLFMLLPLS
jgi:hypothetical protein